MRIYVGYKAGKREVFKSATTPSGETHGHLFNAVVGPFRTMRGAKWAASAAAIGNPHFQTVKDAERIALGVKAEAAVAKLLGKV